jgi:hypothetical protein
VAAVLHAQHVDIERGPGDISWRFGNGIKPMAGCPERDDRFARGDVRLEQVDQTLGRCAASGAHHHEIRVTQPFDVGEIRIPFPGWTELARWCGALPESDGKMPRDLTKALKAAMESLTSTARVIIEPVLVRDEEGHLEKRYLVTQDLWVRMVTLTPPEGGGRAEVWADIHPAAVGSLLRSYVEREPDLYERHKAARKALGAREMRNEWSILEDYLLRRALVAAGDAFVQSLPEKARTGKAKKAARAAAKLVDHGEAEGERTVVVEVSRTHLWELLSLDTMVRDRGRNYVLERERDAFTFCELTGALLTVTERKGKNGDTVFVCTLPHPDRGRHDPAQLTMLPPVAEVEA